jgi:rRNA processing protein Krr1/Pno1
VVTYIKEGEKLANITVKVPSDIVGIIGEHKNVEIAALAFEDFIEELKYRKMKIYSLLEVSEAKDEEKIAEKYFK